MHFLQLLLSIHRHMMLLDLPALRVAFLLVWTWFWVPAVGAFPAYIPPTGHTVSSSFRFPGISYNDGLRHIHTLEHLETIASEYFRINRASQPVRYGDFVTLSADCLIQGMDHTICMISRPDQNHTSTYLCLKGASQLAQIRLRVHQAKKVGHILTMETTYYSGKRVLDRNLGPTRHFLSFFEEKTKYQGLQCKPHPNLQWYRRMVLGPFRETQGGAFSPE
jgi:hypothetical protein